MPWRTRCSVLDVLAEHMRGRTPILSAHRLTSVRDCARIFVLSRGRLVESGTHAELHARNGVYRELYDAQLRGSREGSSRAERPGPPSSVAREPGAVL